MKNGKVKSKKVVVMVSGGFDPIHIGHVRLFNEAKKLGDKLVVVINNDNWKRQKRKHVFMPDHERKEIIEALSAVDKVFISEHGENPEGPREMSVSRELLKIKPHIFANGGDRNEEDAKNPNSSLYYDIETCKNLGIEMVFNVGHGGKVQSSSWLVEKSILAKIKDKKHKK
ncbi:MAG: adenylyltransferase/cytidyltransferase family protein [Candidatus Paceibacterota bacterium]|jgi:D-beta-D-heptose 7-phosphate kinase/D-beta-D-heptose 1-phosphate adenosyltransferase